MRKFLLAGAGLTLLAGGVAIAQTPGQPPAPPGPPPGEMRPPMGGEMGGWGRHMGGPPSMRAMMQGSKAAQFHFARGENRIDIRCAADEPTKACVDAATTLLDKLASQPQR